MAFQKRWIEGKRLVRYEPNEFHAGHGHKTQDPTLWFETDVGAYGIEPIYIPYKKLPKVAPAATPGCSSNRTEGR